MIHIALPLMAENKWIDPLLLSLRKQTDQDYICWICVNQPESWRTLAEKQWVYDDNQMLLKRLLTIHDMKLEIMDCSSIGKGWQQKKRSGIGWARKYLMDHISADGDAEDILLSMDGDTVFNSDYLASVRENLNKHPNASALAVPYRHQDSQDPAIRKAILRYEIYLRHYAIQLYRIESPYAFTALGSAIATRLKQYRAINGISPKASGEDFYFLQNLRKYGPLLTWNSSYVYPAARASDRVAFGTGPAVIKGLNDDWKSYPIYSHSEFDLIAECNRSFEQLYEEDRKTPVDDFLKIQLRTDNPWTQLRKNYKDPKRFIRACHDRLDGLRILQFLKQRHNHSILDVQHLKQAHNIFTDLDDYQELHLLPETILMEINNSLIDKEESIQKSAYKQWDLKCRW